jgi:transcriptional regulator with XRE-family HTH domain
MQHLSYIVLLIKQEAERMPGATLDIAAFYAALDAKRTAAQRSWREVARELELSASTFSRLAQGKRPDVDTFVTLVQWLGMPAETFIRSAHQTPHEPETLVAIATHLQADRQLSPDAATSLQQLVQVAYRMATQQDP